MALGGLSALGTPGEAESPWPLPEWARPWLAPFAADGAAVRQACASGQPLPRALTEAFGLRSGAEGMGFVPQDELPAGTAYEQHIFDTGQVPTREGLHDFFNGLVWMRFPATKRRLNRLQATEIARAGGVGPQRGPVRDALTLFDENAVLLQAPEALWAALLARDWRRLFIELRPLWTQARVVVFGHALLEKLVAPYPSITGHVFCARVPLELDSDLAAWDAWLAERLLPEELATKPFTPLPVLGVPGWWDANEAPNFYDDVGIFRPPRVTV